MSVFKSPTNKELKSSSQPDLSKLDDVPLKTITTRKRKQPDRECECKQDFKEMRNEFSRVTALLEKFMQSQEQNFSSIRDHITEINCEIKDIRASTSNIVLEQNNIKASITIMDKKVSVNEEKLESLETQLTTLKSKPSYTHTAEGQFHANEEIIRELKDRTNRECNIIMAGVLEPQESNDLQNQNKDVTEVCSILSAITKDYALPLKVFRIGKQSPGKNRRIKICFNNSETAKTFLRNQHRLPKEIKLFSDQTPSQIKFLQELKEELVRRQNSGENNLTIKYIKGIPKIVPLDAKNSKNN